MTLRYEGVVERGTTTIDVGFTVERGETLALVGPNGAGKSSVLDAIAGLLPLTGGAIDVDGAVWDDGGQAFLPPAQRSVGAVFQSYRLFDHLDAVDNVAFGLRARRIDRSTARARAVAALERLGIAECAHRRPDQLSGGQSQRVAVARALVVEPVVVLLDEPTAALDASARGAVRHELDDWLREIDAHRILVTHDPVDAHALADRVVVVEHGVVTQRGTMAELAAAPRSDYVADLLGTNLLRGELSGGELTTPDGVLLSVGAHAAPDGPVVATVRPAAIALHRQRPEGSPRNVWSTTVTGVDVADGRVRVRLGEPLELVVEVTGAGFGALDVAVGGEVWASVKASEIGVVADR